MNEGYTSSSNIFYCERSGVKRSWHKQQGFGFNAPDFRCGFNKSSSSSQQTAQNKQTTVQGGAGTTVAAGAESKNANNNGGVNINFGDKATIGNVSSKGGGSGSSTPLFNITTSDPETVANALAVVQSTVQSAFTQGTNSAILASQALNFVSQNNALGLDEISNIAARAGGSNVAPTDLTGTVTNGIVATSPTGSGFGIADANSSIPVWVKLGLAAGVIYFLYKKL